MHLCLSHCLFHFHLLCMYVHVPSLLIRVSTEHPQRRLPTSLEEETAEKKVKFNQEAGRSTEEDDRDLSGSRNLDRAMRLDEVDDEFERIKRRRKNPGVAMAMQVILALMLLTVLDRGQWQ